MDFHSAPDSDDDYKKTKIQLIAEIGELRKSISGLLEPRAELLEREEISRILSETTTEAILFYQDDRIVYANHALETLTGYSIKELLQMNIWEPVHPDFKALIKERVRARQGGDAEPSHYEVRIIKKSGEERWADMTARRIDYKGKPAGLVTLRDITDRKQADDALKDHMHFLQALIDSIAIPIFYKNTDGIYLGCNAAFEKYLGMTREQIVGKTVYEVSPKDLANIYHEADLALLKEGGVQVYESSVVYADGTRHNVIFNKSTFTGARGSPAGLIGAIFDITERKHAEAELRRIGRELEARVKARTEELTKINEALRTENVVRKHAEDALRESEERLDAIIDGSQIPQFVIDKDHRVIYWNKAVEKYSGIKAQDIIGTNRHWKAFYSQERPCMVDFLVDGKDDEIPKWYHGKYKESRLIEGAYEGIEFFPILGEKGTWIYYTAKAIRDSRGGIIGAMETLEDITERMLAEEALRKSERKFRAIFDQTFQLIGLLDVDGTLIEVNQTALKFVGAEESDVLGKPFWEGPWWSYSGELQERLRRSIKKAADGEFIRFEAAHRLSDGSLRYIDFSIKPVADETGRVVMLIPEGRDITERKRAEGALEDAKNQAELYVDLMGHDISNLNHAIMGYLELAVDMLDLKEDEKELIARPIELVKSSTTLIDNVKKLRRIKSGKLQTEVKDLGQAIEEARSRHMDIPGRDVTINYTPVRGCLITANDLLKDVFSNLMENAIKHSQGAITVNIALTTTYGDGHKYYKVIVEDNGPGMPDELKNQVLDRLCLVKLGATGRGMGLCLVKAILDSYHGTISVEDRMPGDHKKGCRFIVTFPAIEA